MEDRLCGAELAGRLCSLPEHDLAEMHTDGETSWKIPLDGTERKRAIALFFAGKGPCPECGKTKGEHERRDLGAGPSRVDGTRVPSRIEYLCEGAP